jgi:hypothetical protein
MGLNFTLGFKSYFGTYDNLRRMPENPMGADIA